MSERNPTPSEGQRIFDEWRKQSDAWNRNRGCNPMDDGPAPSLPEMIDLALAKLQEENNRLKQAGVFVNTWGKELFESLAKFMADAAKSSGPMSTKILCQFTDQPEYPVLHLWASSDGTSPIARNAELRQLLAERDREIMQIQDGMEAALEKAREEAREQLAKERWI